MSNACAQPEALALVFPVWFDGLPAIMQGYFQRVFVPGVATVIDDNGLFHPNLWNLKRMAAVCAYGESRADVAKKRDPPRRFVRDNIGALIDPKGRLRLSRPLRHELLDRAPAGAFLRWDRARLRRVVAAHGGSSAASSANSPRDRGAPRRSRPSFGRRRRDPPTARGLVEGANRRGSTAIVARRSSPGARSIRAPARQPQRNTGALRPGR